MTATAEVILESSKGILQILEEDKLGFTPEKSDLTLLWDLVHWQKSEKAKKNAKVRLTFSKRCSYCISNDGNLASELELYENLQKNVIIIDFENDRDTLELFCNEISTGAAKKLKELQEKSKPKQPDTESIDGKEEEPSDHQLTLAQEKDINTLYNSLVKGLNAVLTPTEFWNNNKDTVVNYKTQAIGRDNSSCFMATPPSYVDSGGSTEVFYTEEMTNTLLEEDETVRNLYNHVVGTRLMKKEEFWKQFFQTHYIYDLLGISYDKNRVLYYEIQGIPIQPANVSLGDYSNVELTSKLPFLHKKADRNPFKKLFDSLTFRFGPNLKYKEPSYDSFIQRFNRHSSSLINQLDSTNVTKTEQDGISKERKDKLLSDSIKFEEFSPKRLKPSNMLVKDKLLEEYSIIDTKREARQQMALETENIDMDLMYNTGKRIFIVNTKSCQTDKSRLISLQYDPSTVDRVRQIQMQLIQLLQIFYKTLIHQDAERKRLLMAMREIKLKLDQSQDTSITSYAGVAKALHAGLLDQINTAECYEVKIKNFIAARR